MAQAAKLLNMKAATWKRDTKKRGWHVLDGQNAASRCERGARGLRLSGMPAWQFIQAFLSLRIAKENRACRDEEQHEV
jgi:hypothetical protein